MIILYLARWRLRAGKPPWARGELTFGKLAVVITFCLLAGACGFGILQIHYSFRLRGWRTRGPSGRALLSITRPQRRGGRALPASGLHPSPQRAYLGGSTTLLNGGWSNGGWNKFHLAYRMLIYRGRTRMRGTSSIVARSTPFWKAERVRLFSFAEVKVLCVIVRFVSYIYAVHLH